MVRRKSFAIVGLSLAVGACTVESGTDAPGTPDPVPSEFKPEDASELEGSNLGSTQQAHSTHYFDGTNLWKETTYPMGTANPQCQDYWVYDQWKPTAPVCGPNTWSTLSTNHRWARGTVITDYLNTIPTNLGYNTAKLLDHNSVVARLNVPDPVTGKGMCSGRYVFQWANHLDYYRQDDYIHYAPYSIDAKIPFNLIPATAAACSANTATTVPHVWIDLYVCEAPLGTNIGDAATWCRKGSGHWRMVGSANQVTGVLKSNPSRCEVSAKVGYGPPERTVAIVFNAVVNAGIGHGVAPAEITVFGPCDYLN